LGADGNPSHEDSAPNVASDDWDNFTVPEKVALYQGYIAYFGRFEIDEVPHVVIHLPEADLSRLYIGRREKRHFTTTGDRLVLSENWTQNGKPGAVSGLSVSSSDLWSTQPFVRPSPRHKRKP